MLRVIQLNVARFQGGLCEITKALKSMIKNPKASIICLNEVYLGDPHSEALSEIASDCLSSPHVSFLDTSPRGCTEMRYSHPFQWTRRCKYI